MTKKEMFNALLAILENGTVCDSDDQRLELMDGIKHEIEMLEKKTADRKPTKTQQENLIYQSFIIEYLTATDAPQTIKDIQANIPELAEASNQKMTHLLTPLVNTGTLIKTYEKKTPFFTIAQ